jgi:uncharacterized protein
MTLWIDLDNSPHVLLFAPIVRELERRGVETLITVRDFAQTPGLAAQHGLSFTTVGRHYGSASKVVKVAGTFSRAASLVKFARGRKITAAVSQGSRGLVLAAKAMRLPVMTLYDYEFASCRLYNMLSDRVLVPDVIPDVRLAAQGLDFKKLTRYPGLKEEVYVYGFRPDLDIADKLELDKGKVIVMVRPPAAWAHYHHERSEIMFRALMEILKAERDVEVVIPARTEAQAEQLRRSYGLNGRFRIFTRPVDGLSLMWCSDVVFSGGGTMTREAALLGLDVYTIFGGRIGAADEFLIRTGKLKSLREPAELDSLAFAKREKPVLAPEDRKQLAAFIADEILHFASTHASKTAAPSSLPAESGSLAG